MLEILGRETSLARIQASLYFHKKDSQKPNNTDSVYKSYSWMKDKKFVYKNKNKPK